MRVAIAVAALAAMPVLGIAMALITDNPNWFALCAAVVFFLT